MSMLWRDDLRFPRADIMDCHVCVNPQPTLFSLRPSVSIDTEAARGLAYSRVFGGQESRYI